MVCKYCREDNGHWDCEYWHCDNCGASTSAESNGIYIEGRGQDEEEDEDDY